MIELGQGIMPSEDSSNITTPQMEQVSLPPEGPKERLLNNLAATDLVLQLLQEQLPDDLSDLVKRARIRNADSKEIINTLPRF